MAGAGGVALAAAAIEGGGVGSLPCALLTTAAMREQVKAVRAIATGPLNLNFFCHEPPTDADDTAWRAALAPFYAEEGVTGAGPAVGRRPFDAEAAAVVEDTRPALVSFHFGLPAPGLVERVRATGAVVASSATTVVEAIWLAERGVDAVIAQGFEAGGHAGWFLEGFRPVGLMALVPQIATALDVPVVAAGGIADARGVRAALALGATGVQVGTAFLATPESLAAPAHRARLGTPASADTVFTNVMTGRMARGLRNRLIDELGPVSPLAPPFPRAADAVAPLRMAAEAQARADYTAHWAGQAAPLSRPGDARDLMAALGAAALEFS